MQDNGVSHAAVETFPITNENKTIRKFGGEIGEEKISCNKRGERGKARKKIVKKFLNLKWDGIFHFPFLTIKLKRD